jgi:hypothetical protein
VASLAACCIVLMKSSVADTIPSRVLSLGFRSALSLIIFLYVSQHVLGVCSLGGDFLFMTAVLAWFYLCVVRGYTVGNEEIQKILCFVSVCGPICR